jgi:hypothetical protein
MGHHGNPQEELEEIKMIFGGLEFVVAGKLIAVAHAHAIGVHAVAVHAANAAATGSTAQAGGHTLAMATQHPMQFALHQATQHGLHSAAKMMMDPSVPLNTKLAIAQAAYSQAAAATAASGPAAAAAVPASWHAVLKSTELVVGPAAMGLARKSEAYLRMKDALSEFLDEAKKAKDLRELKNLMEAWKPTLLAGAPQQLYGGPPRRIRAPDIVDR